MSPSCTIPQTTSLSASPCIHIGYSFICSPLNLLPPFCPQRSTRLRPLSGTHAQTLHFSRLPFDNCRHPVLLRRCPTHAQCLFVSSRLSLIPRLPSAQAPSARVSTVQGVSAPPDALPSLWPSSAFSATKGRFPATNEALPPFWRLTT